MQARMILVVADHSVHPQAMIQSIIASDNDHEAGVLAVVVAVEVLRRTLEAPTKNHLVAVDAYVASIDDRQARVDLVVDPMVHR